MRKKPNLAKHLLFLYLCRSFRSFTFRSISNWSYMCSISEVICLSVTPSTIHTKHCTIFTSSSLEAFFSCMDMPSKMLLRLRRTLGGRWDSGMAVPGFSGSTVAYMRSPARTEPMHLTWITPITQTTSVSSKKEKGNTKLHRNWWPSMSMLWHREMYVCEIHLDCLVYKFCFFFVLLLFVS